MPKRSPLVFAVLCLAARSAAADSTKDAYVRLAKALTKTTDKDTRASLTRIAKQKPAPATLASSAAALAATGRKDAALVYVGRAAELDPADATIANNLGVTLDLAGRPKDAVDVLRYTLTLDKDNLLASTNLATALHDSGDDTAAEKLLKQVLAREPTFCLATSALGLILASKGSDQEALEYLQAGLACGPTPALADTLKRVQMRSRPSSSPPKAPAVTAPELLLRDPPPPGSMPLLPAMPATAPKVAPETSLVLPPFPDWPDVPSLLAAGPNLDAWSKGLSKQINARMDRLGDIVSARLDRQAGPFPTPVTKPAIVDALVEYAYSDAEPKLVLAALERYEQQQLSAISKDIDKATTALDQPFMGAGAAIPIPTASDCLAHQSALRTEYQSWRALARRRYDETVRIVRAYYEQTGPVVARIIDPEERELADISRQMSVLVTVQALIPEYTLFRPIFYGTQNGLGCTSSTPDAQPTPSAQPDDAHLRNAGEGSCPDVIKKGLLSLDMYAVRVKLTCDKVSVGVDTSVLASGSVSFDYKTGELTAFAGAGLPTFRAGAFSASARAGFYMTFDLTKGDLVAAGIAGSGGVKLGGTESVTGGVGYQFDHKIDVMPYVALALAPYGGTVRNVKPNL